ncbi:methyl-accepting chemotaxis protein [Bdellovibrio sp. HCB274]|uniref:methyl-accepting chemotaxis protein n=1 Tax=Bdellovibrio sp. HCB274 TaxID=3394361 RepID=UPI0039B44E51
MKKRSLNFKMIFVMGLLMVSSLSIAAIGLINLSNMNDTMEMVVREKSARVSLIKDIRSLFYIQLINEKNYILSNDDHGRSTVEKLMKERHSQMEVKMNDLHAISTPTGQEELKNFKAIYDTWWTNVESIRNHVQSGNTEHAEKISLTENKALRHSGEKVIDSTVERNEKNMQLEVVKMEESYKEARTVMILVSFISILLGGAIGGVVLMSLSKSINEVIGNLSSSSKEVSGASTQIATAATELSQSTTEQAASLEESVATIEELTSMIKLNAENASSAAKLSSQTSELAKRGEIEMKALSKSMTDIAADSKKISDIIDVIDDIAFQTNLLALNAAVEAARAGEQGKGFAVVAEAVRALSQRSASAAKDIGDLIRSSVHRIEDGNSQAQKSGEVLEEILTSVKKVSDFNQEIASASAEQSNGVAQISKALNQLDQTTQINAASSEEAAASSEELAAQAECLAQVIQTLVSAIKGTSNSTSYEQMDEMPLRKRTSDAAFAA